MQSVEEYYEIYKYFAKGKQRDSNANEVQKHLQLCDLNIGEYLTNKYALWIDFRTINENSLHGTGWKIGSVGEGITLQIKKKAETAGELYLIMDAQLNIKEGVFILLCIRKNTGDKRTYGTVCSSNKSRKNTLSLGLTQKRVLQSFQFHYYYLYHSKTQCYIQESKVALDRF